MMGRKTAAAVVCVVALLACVAQQASAQAKKAEAAPAKKPAPTKAVTAAADSYVGEILDKCCYGGDLRIRWTEFEDIPRGPGVWPENGFFRIRTRLWGQYDPTDDVTIKARLVNEFRDYDKPDTDAWENPDEVIFDKLYVELRNLMDGKLDVKVGRQDLIYGTGKVVLEGTPMDGSRTIYFNAAKAVWRAAENTTVDFFAIYNEPVDDMAINSEDRDLNFRDVTESGGGVYVKCKSEPALPMEAYAIYKNESTWDAVMEDGTVVEQPELDVTTVGIRLMPPVLDGINANVEAAYQFGERGDVDVEGLMADVSIKAALPVCEKMKPSLAVGWYYLSGDDPTTEDQEDWNPLWARYPQLSEMYVYTVGPDGPGHWENVNIPYAMVSVAPSKSVRAKALVGFMNAPEDGPGGGNERGVLYVFRTDFTLAEGLLTEKDRVFGHLTAEVLDVGDFHAMDESAYFARAELSYAF